VQWSGSTGVGYDHYDRGHHARALPAADGIDLSSDPAFRGDPARTNPEQLLVLAASSCQLLSFLAVAARARLDVVAYTDAAEAVMPEDDPPVRITGITLRPHIRRLAAPVPTRRPSERGSSTWSPWPTAVLASPTASPPRSTSSRPSTWSRVEQPSGPT
jgi:organic hydroperoxide reductase OsmC/OhrA